MRTHARSTDNADQLLAGFGRGARLFTLTKGLCSTLDVLDALLRRTGPAVEVDLAFWTVGMDDLGQVADWMERGRFRRLRCLLGGSFFQRHADYAAYLLTTFGVESIRLVETHAKFATICGAGWNIALTTSANLNRNARYEWVNVEDSGQVCGFLRGFVDAEFTLPANPGASRSQVRKRFRARPLEDGAGVSEKMTWADLKGWDW